MQCQTCEKAAAVLNDHVENHVDIAKPRASMQIAAEAVGSLSALVAHLQARFMRDSYIGFYMLMLICMDRLLR